MKLIIYTKTFSCICLFLLMASSAAAGDISGSWVADVDNSHMEMTFAVDGTNLTGNVENSATGTAVIKEGKIDENKISFHILSKLPGFGDSEFKVSWTGEIIGDEILFKREFAGTSKGVIARRKPATSDDQAKQKDAQNDAGSYDHLTGTWTGKVPLGEIYLDLLVKGSSVNGSVNINGTAVGEIKDGKIEGEKITFHAIRKMGFNTTDIPFEGTVKDEKIHFSFISVNNGRPVNFVATKMESGTVIDDGSYDDLTGKWVLNSGQNNIVMLIVEGKSLSGTVDVNNMGPVEITDGKIEGGKLSFHVIREINFNEFDATWKGSIVGDEIHFNVLLNGSNLSFIARKEENAEPGTKEQAAQNDKVSDDHISGKWKANSENGVMLMDFKVVGSDIAGTAGLKDLGNDKNEIMNGKIQGDKIAFNVNTRMMNRMLIVGWNGKIIDDKIHFTTQLPGVKELHFIAKKIEVDEKGQEKEEIQLPPTVDPSGTWIMEANGQQITMSFKAVGMSLTGFVRIPPQTGNIMIPPDAKISGDNVSFSLTKRIGPNLFRIPWTGKVIGNEIHFEGGPFNQFEDVIAKKIRGAGEGDEGKILVKLLRDEEIKSSKVSEDYKKLRQEDKEYDSAMSYFDEYRYDFSLPLLEQLYKRMPDNPVLLHRLGVCLIMQSIFPTDIHDRKDMRARARVLLQNSKKQGMENELLDYYLKVIPADGGADDVFSKFKESEMHLSEAEKYFGLRDFQTCIVLYANAMEKDPTNYRAVLYVGDSYFANGQYKDAVEWFERATKSNPDKETAWRFWGDCLMHMDKKEEGRLRFIDALIAEPYNQLSWNGVRNFVNINKLKLEPPDIQRPQRLDANGELLLPEKNSDSNDSLKSLHDGTEAWKYYNEVVKKWRSKRFRERYPDKKEYRHTLEEEKEALELVAEKVNDKIKKGKIQSKDLNHGIKTLLELDALNLLEPYILFHLADRDIIEDYPAYRNANRDKLEQYLDRFEVPTGEKREL
ncbi:MAG: tetratricopeptide repeat protein [Deltaproteobacteria bacterium]|nr:tetratricopeptide repeat protein [Deltaproteobacteria bacterium]